MWCLLALAVTLAPQDDPEPLHKLDLSDLRRNLVPKVEAESSTPASTLTADTLSAPASVPAPAEDDRAGWFEDPATGHWFGLSAPATWEEAEAEARALDGHLATVHSMTQMDWLRARFGDDRLWIGLSDHQKEGVFRWAWGGHERFRYWSWARPDNLGEREHFVYLNHNVFGEWDDGAALPDGQPLRGIIELRHPPHDLDADGILDAREYALGLDPRDRDSDDDGIADGMELLPRDQGGTGTDPARKDSDGNGLVDGIEAGLLHPVPGDPEQGILGTNLAVFEADRDPAIRAAAVARAEKENRAAEAAAREEAEQAAAAHAEQLLAEAEPQPLQLRAAPLRDGRVVHLEVIGAEAGARLLPMVSTAGILPGNLESGIPDVLAAPVYTMPQVRAGAAGVVAVVVPLPPLGLGTELWAQVIEIGASGVPRYSAPVAMLP